MLIKQPYELSVWTEQLEDGIKVEKKGAIIGAHDMTYLGKATNICLKREIKGTATLSFDMPSKYFDSKLGDYVHNDFVDKIFTETKVKLYYKEKWYEFFIKKITENKKFKAIMYSYSCQDSFIDELSRTGYDIELAPELNNSVAETGDFMEEILEYSQWDYISKYNIGDFTEFKEQRFYRIPLEQFGGSIYGYEIKLSVTKDMFFQDDKITPKETFKNYLKQKGIDWNTIVKEGKIDSYINSLITIYNVLTNDERIVEFGDDLARELEIFWDPYYQDNGVDLLNDNNRVELNSKYIYVPITDLSMIMGSVYKDAKKAVEEPAIYGEYPNNSKGYALQPYSKNPRALIQFICFSDGADIHIDEAATINNNNYHYVLPIEEWNNLLKKALNNDNGLIYWYAVSSNMAEKNYYYDIKEDNNYAYTINVRPETSTIDDFTWYPVYFDGYLEDINGEQANKARKISVTDRTEYNKNADSFVTIYNNKAEEYANERDENGKYSLYSEKAITDYINKGNDLRVNSKLHTRQILPELARNLVTNGSDITDTNGWEPMTQNRNSDKLLGTGSSVELMKITAKSTIDSTAKDEVENTTQNTQKNLEDYKIDGRLTNEESIKDYYLEILSPVINKTEDFSLEGRIEQDYALNMGIISQDKKIEKGKVYALQMITGTKIPTAVLLKYRNPNLETKSVYFKGEDFKEKAEAYKQTLQNYKKLLDLFKNADLNSFKEASNGKYEAEAKLFYEIIERWPLNSDKNAKKKIDKADVLLKVILFGEKKIDDNKNREGLIWKNDVNNYEEEILNDTQYQGIIKQYDSNTDGNELYKQLFSVAITPTYTDNKYIFTNSDVIFLRSYLYDHIGKNER